MRHRFRRDLVLAATAFVLALGLDFMQYVVASLIWGAYSRRKEKVFKRDQIPLDLDFDFPRAINWPALFFFWTKIATLAVGQFVLFAYLAHHWNVV
jgi:hypothetical protein